MVIIELTEDQAYSIVNLIESWLESAKWAEQHDKATEYTREHLAFRKRILAKLAQGIVTEQAKN